ncbi:hypothetical protein HN014_22440 (plasmid) [Aquimarina sp. TRL1]|uniref:hypothetical protein n=1 Tax=Aquimarina sp. (strain TRL1) TaxID=2736252 RepID=UPI001588DC5F|nr:hypothetical protein [Aquimarina sp. TRL1]QKX07761.1 hypothetical protein HN014_22440 [Aquimarina sp. TRL1]
MSEIVNLFQDLRGNLATIATMFVDVVKYLSFIAMLILILTSVVTDRNGSNIGFSAGRWAIIAGVVGTLIAVAQEIFGV